MALTLRLHSILRYQIIGFPFTEYTLKLGEYGYQWRVADDSKHVTIELTNIPSNDQFLLFVEKFATQVEPNVYDVDLETLNQSNFTCEAIALLSRMYIDMMISSIRCGGDAVAETAVPQGEVPQPSETIRMEYFFLV
ncbi:hypothetical protein JTE90_003914 [Oedothorax gibbosus]|uniref:Uncharacterized protein n=1 Tax=Oedothorax gibbosus TaxID=931172 RepID=A0AAV6TL85_9ARAC|nr:hypothetical protein JTE90_003914 [Oedothorax gibbosus]